VVLIGETASTSLLLPKRPTNPFLVNLQKAASRMLEKETSQQGSENLMVKIPHQEDASKRPRIEVSSMLVYKMVVNAGPVTPLDHMVRDQMVNVT
jgi:hypothetical protein